MAEEVVVVDMVVVAMEAVATVAVMEMDTTMDMVMIISKASHHKYYEPFLLGRRTLKFWGMTLNFF